MAKPKDKYDMIIRPLVTEKAIGGAEKTNSYSFKVHLRANKTQIRKAVEEIFSVKVKAVRTANVKGKPGWVLRRGRRHPIRRSPWKKAVVTLAEDHRIDIV